MQRTALENVKELIIAGANLKWKSVKGSTALTRACRYRHIGAVKLLLTAIGISINEKNSKGWSALLMACNHGMVTFK
jgi:ankyrin repeat protein